MAEGPEGPGEFQVQTHDHLSSDRESYPGVSNENEDLLDPR